MDTLRLMLLSLLIGVTVSTSPTYTDDGFQVNQTIVVGQQADQASAVPQFIYVTPAPNLVPVPPVTSQPVSSTAGSTKIYTGTSITRELFRGCEGDDVRMLQKLLNDLGYTVTVDGVFGTQVRSRVLEFQRNNGLKADGIAGTRTIRKLVSADAVPSGGSTNRTSLSYGMKGQDVLNLQYRLTSLGYYSDVCSGNYLNNTRNAVRWFQQVNGLSVDGIAGPITLSRVYGASAIPAPSGHVYPTKAPGGAVFARTLYKGLSGADVTYLQQLLAAYGYLSIAPTGYFGSETYWAVSTFQSYNGLYVDGIAGTATLNLLTSGRVVPYPGYTSKPTTPPQPTWRPQPTQPPQNICNHCNRVIMPGETKHSTYAACGAHMLCQSGNHSTLMACGHYTCAHGMHPCGIHPECMDPEGNHGLLPCGAHFFCNVDGYYDQHQAAH